ncbi:MAG: hypothetical protein EGQ16_06720 [Clostridiales bacterium]|nr:hypothetical protein [Clostridiales bacterium]
MAVFINLIIIVIYLISIAAIWTSLENEGKTKKISIIIIGILAMFLITNIIFNISKSTINYENIELQKNMRQIILWLFTGLNSLFLPVTIRNIVKTKNGEQDENALKVKILVLAIIFILVMILECGYIKDIQEKTINIYQSNKSEVNTYE